MARKKKPIVSQKEMEVALPFASAFFVFVGALYDPVLANGIALICLTGIGAYYHYYPK